MKSEHLGYNHSLDASNVASLIELYDEEEEPTAVNLYLCSVKGEPDNMFATVHWDGGVLVKINGPWQSVDDAKKSYGFVKDGWSDF